ncbi:MAG: SCP2 sterol-binding domain-containing protein [Candidatus Lokiarchaeota archaeon]|nr:SCP2 sterol-binding domain-containing protein [Candidatus Lokiarchaeota archaeon]
MDVKEELLIALNKWAAKLDDPLYKEKFKGFDKTLQFNFTDQSFNLLMVFKNKMCELSEGSVSNPDIIISTSSKIILGITNGEINPLKAFLSRKLKAKGNRTDMLKVQMLMKKN